MASRYGKPEYGMDDAEYTVFRRFNDALRNCEIARDRLDRVISQCESVLRKRGAITARNNYGTQWIVVVADSDGNEIGYNAETISHAFDWLRNRND